MADVICRWRNATPKTVCEFVEKLPHQQMSAEDFRLKMEPVFFRTAYQLACQLGLYYEDNGIYIPRFDHNITEEEATRYLEYWIHCYYAPNPFTKSLNGLKEPVYLIEALVKYAEYNGGKVELRSALQDIFKDPMGNMDIITNALNKYSKVIYVEDGYASLNPSYKQILKSMPNRNDKEAFFKNFDSFEKVRKAVNRISDLLYQPYLTALRTKPFMLLAGISGTGKSRIVKEMAFHTCPNMTELRKDKVAPGNYQLIEVKPNWHDSSELLGYESALKNTYVVTSFVKFLCKAMKYPNVPFFVCLDEMNLAPVEQYFAEFLSVLESRKKTDDGISSEALIPADVFAKYDLLRELFDIKEAGARNTSYTADQTTEASAYYGKETTIYDQLTKEGLRIPANLIVIGTVNMDETTHQFSRKVIDRAMTIEMNEVNFGAFFTDNTELDYLDEPLNAEFFLSKYVSAKEAMADLSEEEQTYLFENVPAVLNAINEALDGTPFKVAYRVQNELIIYYAELRDTNADGETADLFKTAVDDILMLKVLPRVEGDKDILEGPLKRLSALAAANGYEKAGAKLQEMSDRLANSPFTSFWP